MNKQTNGRTKYIQIDIIINGQTDKRTNEQTDKWTNGANGQMGK